MESREMKTRDGEAMRGVVFDEESGFGVGDNEGGGADVLGATESGRART